MPIQIVGDDRNKPEFSITAAFHTLVILLLTVGGILISFMGLTITFTSVTNSDLTVGLIALLLGVTSFGLGLILSFLKRIAKSLES